MTDSNRFWRQLLLALVAGTVVGCLCGGIVISVMALMQRSTAIAALFQAPTPTPLTIPTAYPTITLMPTRSSTSTPGARSTLLPTMAPPTVPPAPTSRPIVQHFLVGRPVAPSATKLNPSWVYLYGTTEKGDLDVHHGEEFENPPGTPLYAVADGTVVTAGSDETPVCGDDGKTVCGAAIYTGGFYGKLVVIQLAQAYKAQRVFALYGHMSRVGVKVGDKVKAGDPIGEIGATGVALGPHVHFEIRLGANDYAHTRNPVLWMTPLAGRGTLVGRYADARGNQFHGALVDIYRADGSLLLETETYGHDKWPPVNSDDEIGENFSVGDIPVGDYTVRINGQPLVQRVTVVEGKLSFVELGGTP